MISWEIEVKSLKFTYIGNKTWGRSLINIIAMILYCRDNSDIHMRMEELEITNKRLIEDNTKLKKHVCGNSILIWKYPVTDVLKNSKNHPIVSK